MRKARRADLRRIPELDGFRTILVFIVSWYHIWQQSWLTPRVGDVSLDFLVRSGYMPVDGTILLSGFLLFLPYARSMATGEDLPDRRDFYRRRVMRIFPSYYFLLLTVLLAVVIPFRLYTSAQFAVKDLFTHLTFTFMFSADTYMATQLGAACWTLALEMQAYLLFPFVAKWVMKRPVQTLGAMILASFAWRGFWVWSVHEYAMVVNQLPSFLDVYALGIMGAMAYVRIQRSPVRREWLRQAIATAVLGICLWAVIRLLRGQASEPSYAMIQRGQMIRRFPFAALLLGIVLSLPFAVRPVRFLMGNRLMGFLAGVSMNYYLIHQIVAVHLKRLGIPASASATPHYDSERPWQYAYTFLTFGLSLLLAVLVTYLVEKPAAKWLRGWFARRDARRVDRMRSALRTHLADCPIAAGDRVLLESFGGAPATVALLVEMIGSTGGEVQVLLRDPQVDGAMRAFSPEEPPLPDCRVYVAVGEIPPGRQRQLDQAEGLRWIRIPS